MATNRRTIILSRSIFLSSTRSRTRTRYLMVTYQKSPLNLGSSKAFLLSSGHAHQPQVSGGDLCFQYPVVGIAESSKRGLDLGNIFSTFRTHGVTVVCPQLYKDFVSKAGHESSSPKSWTVSQLQTFAPFQCIKHSTCFRAKWGI